MLTKQAIDVSFAKGLDTKTDPKRVAIGNFVRLENSVFDKGGELRKRNGYGSLSPLPDSTYTYLTTFNGDLTAIGSTIAAYNQANANFVPKGTIQPMSVSTLPIIRNNLNQISADSAIAPNGLVCTVYLETDGSTTTNKYVIADSVTGQNIVAPSVIPVASGAVSGGMRVFVLGAHFILVFTNTIAGTAHLQYVAISTANPTVVGANTDIAASYIAKTTLSWDGYVAGGFLYLAYNTTSGGQAIKVTSLSVTLTLASAKTFAGQIATMVSVFADTSSPSATTVWVSYYDSPTTAGYTLAVDTSLNQVLGPTQFESTRTLLNITSAAQNSVNTIFTEVSHTDSNTGLVCNFVNGVTVTIVGVVGSTYVVVRSVGLASKATIIASVIYFLSVYSSAYQPTYFLINGTLSTSAAPSVAGKLAYQNGGGYLATGLPSLQATGATASAPYLFKDLIQAVNKNTNVPSGTQVNGIYSQTGINLGSFTIGTAGLDTAEIGHDLHLSGGFLWMYDGYLPVEHNFLVYPDLPAATAHTTGGSMSAQQYFYQVTYEWTDNQGNAFRSAPSIPITVTTTAAIASVTLSIPTLRLTYKTANPVKIVIYRWSAAQESYYQTTSISAPLLNDTTVDSVQFLDPNADATILGNNLIYTTGGVVEDVSAPASNLLTQFDTRLWLVDAEDPNLLWFSKQVIEATPVEMSDLLTMYVPQTVGSATGQITSIYPMDDKLIISKGGNSLVYINGAGPDNTGAQNFYSNPIFITSTVGCANQQSMVLTPNGLMFQSNKGIWLLGRGLEADYIGAAVEDFTTGATVNSAVLVSGTNQVRFTLSSGITLMYDYYYGQWGVFVGVGALSSTIYQGLHTYINASSEARQETPGLYIDGGNPVLMAFKTGPLRLDQLQSYQRAYFFYLLGTYISPHKLVLSMSYDYESSPSQSVIISPTNYSAPFGSGALQSPFGQGAPFGGGTDLYDWRIFLERQRCMAFAITLQEVYDATLGAPAGAGFTLSGLSVICGFKSKFRPQSAAHSNG